MSFDRTLALRLQLIADFSTATKEASSQLKAVVSGLKQVQKLGKEIDISGLDSLGAAVGKVAAGVSALEQKTRAAADASKNLSNAARSAQSSVGMLVPVYSKAAEAADKAARAAAGFANAAQKIETIRVNSVGQSFLNLGDDIFYAHTRLKALTSDYEELQRLASSAPKVALPPPAYRPSNFQQAAGYSAAQAAAQLAVMRGYNPPPPGGSRALAAPGGGAPVPLGNGSMYMPPAGGGGVGGGIPPYGPGPFSFGGGGFNWTGGGKKMWSVGSNMSSMGMGAAINFAMLAPLVKQLVGNMADIDDLMSRTKSAFNGSPELADKFNQYLADMVGRIGGDFKDTISSGYNIISSIPEGFNYNSKEGMAVLEKIAERNAKLTIIGGSSTHKVTNEETDLATNAMLKHFFGSDVKDPAKFLRDSQMITNTLANLRSQTSTETDLAGNSFRQIGPMAKAMGIPFEDIAAMVGILAQNKTRGNEAGNALKRILSRQNAPAGQLEKVEQLFASKGMNISLYDANGKMRDPFTMFESIYKAEHAPNVTQRDRAYINQQLSGLYAVKDFSNLLESVHEMGGAAGARAYGNRLVHEGGAKGKDALNTQYEKRTNGNLLIQGQQVMGKTLNELHKVFKLIEPDLSKFLDGVGHIVDVFDKLPDPVKKFLAEGLLFTAFLNGGIGIMGLFVGNLLKMVGGGMQLIGWLKEMQLLGPIGSLFTRFAGLAVTGIRAVGLALVANPIGLAITAIIAAVALLYEAWTHDWGGIREKTSGAVDWIKKEIPKIPEQLGWLVGRVFSFLATMEIKWISFWLHFPQYAIEAAVAVAKFFIDVLPKWIEGGIKWVGGLKDAILKAIPGIWHDIQTAVVNGVKDVFNFGKTLVDSGVKAAKQFAQGVKEGARAGKPQVQNALDNMLGSQVPHSEPKDSSSPLYGLTDSGKTAMHMFADGVTAGANEVKGQVQVAFDNTFSGSLHDGLVRLEEHSKSGKKKKKGKGPLHAYIIEIKDQSLAEIEQMAKELEAALAAKGAHLRDEQVFFTSHGKSVGSLHVDPSVLRNAMRSGKDNSVPQLHSTLNAIRLAGGDAATTLKKELAAAQDALVKATDISARTTISGIIVSLRKQYDSLTSKLRKEFYGKDGNGGSIASLNKAFTSFDNKSSSFDQVNQKYNEMLQQRIDLRKNKELPTAQELRHERTLEEDQLRRLTQIYKQELEQRTALVGKVNALSTEIGKLNDKDSAQASLKKQLQAQLDQYNLQLTSINETLDVQSNSIQNVNTELIDNTKAMSDAMNASSAWERVLVSATQNAGKAALNHLVDTFDAGIDTMLENAFGKWKGKGITGSLKSAIGDFFGSFISELLHSAVDNLMKYAQQTLTHFFNNMLSTFFNGTSTSNSGFNSGADAAVNEVVNSAMGGGPSSAASSAMSTAMQSSMAAASPYIAAFIATQMAANVFGNMMGGGSHVTNAKIGGGLFGLVGAFIGSLFGHKGPNKQDNPDMFPDSGWGQENADLWGATASREMHANGQSYVESSAVSQETGGKGMLQYIAAWIAANPAQAKQILGDQTVALFSGLNVDTPIVGGTNGNLNLANGQKMYYSQLYDAAQKAITSINGLGNAAAGAADQMGTDANRMADSFATLIWGGPAGFSLPQMLESAVNSSQQAAGGGDGSNPGDPVPKRNPVPLPRKPIKRPPMIDANFGNNLDPGRGAANGGSAGSSGDINITLKVLEGASVSSAQLVDEIRAVIPQLKDTLANAVAERQYRNARLRGNTVSQI